MRSWSAFDAYGALRAAATADAADTFDPIGFGGQHGYYHDYSGLYLLTHRYYDAGTGRFVTRDPIGYKGGINLYGFAGNNPVNESDPSGFDPGDPGEGDLSMRSLHPGMHAGTARSGMARAMTRSLLSTLEDAVVGVFNPEGRLAEGALEAVQAARVAKAEANAARNLAHMEAGNPGAHFFSRHGSHTTLAQQQVRATTGLTPDGFAGNAVDSTRFASHQLQMGAAQRAETIFRQTGRTAFSFNYGQVVGEGYTRGGSQLLNTSRVQAVFRNGKLYTLYPKLR